MVRASEATSSFNPRDLCSAWHVGYLAFKCSCRTGPSWLQLTLQRRQLLFTDKPSQVISRSRKRWTRSSSFGSDVKRISSSWVWKVNLFLPGNYGSASSRYANPDFRVTLLASRQIRFNTCIVLFEFFKALCKHQLINQMKTEKTWGKAAVIALVYPVFLP